MPNNSQEKIYLNGGGKEFKFDNGGSVMNIYVDIDDAMKKGAVSTSKAGKRYLNLTISENREVTEFGDTHHLYFRDWKSKSDSGKSSGKPKGKAGKKTSLDDDEDELPF